MRLKTNKFTRKFAPTLIAMVLAGTGFFALSSAQAEPPGTTQQPNKCCSTGKCDDSCVDWDSNCEAQYSRYCEEGGGGTGGEAFSDYCCTSGGGCCKDCKLKNAGECPDGLAAQTCPVADIQKECKKEDSTPGTQTTGGGDVTKTYTLSNPFGTSDLRTIIGRFGSMMTNIVGSLALLMFVYGGFVMLTSRGNPEKIKQGQGVFVWTIVGLVIIFAAQALITAIINILSQGSL